MRSEKVSREKYPRSTKSPCGPVGGSQREAIGRHGALTSTDHKDVARVGRVASHAKELEKVPELAMNVTTDGHWRVDRLNVGLLEEERLDEIAQLLDVLLWQILALL